MFCCCFCFVTVFVLFCYHGIQASDYNDVFCIYSLLLYFYFPCIFLVYVSFKYFRCVLFMIHICANNRSLLAMLKGLLKVNFHRYLTKADNFLACKQLVLKYIMEIIQNDFNYYFYKMSKYPKKIE